MNWTQTEKILFLFAALLFVNPPASARQLSIVTPSETIILSQGHCNFDSVEKNSEIFHGNSCAIGFSLEDLKSGHAKVRSYRRWEAAKFLALATSASIMGYFGTKILANKVMYLPKYIRKEKWRFMSGEMEIDDSMRINKIFAYGLGYSVLGIFGAVLSVEKFDHLMYLSRLSHTLDQVEEFFSGHDKDEEKTIYTRAAFGIVFGNIFRRRSETEIPAVSNVYQGIGAVLHLASGNPYFSQAYYQPGSMKEPDIKYFD